jgi:hypothetical protein
LIRKSVVRVAGQPLAEQGGCQRGGRFINLKSSLQERVGRNAGGKLGSLTTGSPAPRTMGIVDTSRTTEIALVSPCEKWETNPALGVPRVTCGARSIHVVNDPASSSSSAHEQRNEFMSNLLGNLKPSGKQRWKNLGPRADVQPTLNLVLVSES